MLRSVCTTARALVATPLQPSITKQSSRTLPIARSFYTRSSRRPHIPIQTLQKYHGALQAQLRPGKSSIFIALGSRNVVNTTRDLKAEEKARNRKLEADPEHVSTTSTVTPILGGTDAPAHEGGDVDMLQGIKSDLVGLDCLIAVLLCYRTLNNGIENNQRDLCTQGCSEGGLLYRPGGYRALCSHILLDTLSSI